VQQRTRLKNQIAGVSNMFGVEGRLSRRFDALTEQYWA